MLRAEAVSLHIIGVPPGAESANEGLAYDRTEIVHP